MLARLLCDSDVLSRRGTSRPSAGGFAVSLLFCLFAPSVNAQCIVSIRLNEPLALGQAVQQSQFSFTPDSALVVYRADQSGNDIFEIFSVPPDRSTPPLRLNGPLVSGGDVDQGYQKTPDGSRLVYVADQEADGRNELYTVSVTGGIPVKLNAPVHTQVLPDFTISPDGNRVVYIADQNAAGRYELFSVAMTGGPTTRLHGDAPGSYAVTSGALISPDSTRVVFAGFLDTWPVLELYSVPITGGAPVKISGPMVSGGAVYSSAFRITPDGMRVVYVADQDVNGVEELYGAPIATAGAWVKLNGPLVSGGEVRTDESILLSPDSQWVLYRADQETDGVLELYAVSPAGGPAFKLNNSLSGSGTGVVRIRVSPDSSDAVFVARHNYAWRLFSAPLNGTSNSAMELTAPFPSNRRVLGDAVVTPDSSTVVYVADHDTAGVYELHKVPIDGSMTTTKLNDPLVSGGRVWSFILSPDGSVVLYTADQDVNDVNELYRLPLNQAHAPVKVSGAMVSGGDVLSSGAVQISPDLSKVVYIADQLTDNVLELFSTYEADSIDLSVSCADSPDPVHAEQLITYAVVVSNHTACDAGGVAITNVLPPGVIYFDASAGCTYESGIVSRLVSTLPALSSTSMSVRVIAPPALSGEVITNVATVSSSATDSDQSNNISTQLTTVTDPVELCRDGLRINQDLIPAGDVGTFVISPDGRRAVFQADANHDDQFPVYSAPLDGSGVPIRLSELSTRTASSPLISPDSQWVVYHQETMPSPNYTAHVFARPIDGSSPSVQISTSALVNVLPQDGYTRVTPDSTRVIYAASYESTYTYDLWLFSAPIDGSAPQVNLSGPMVAGGSVAALSQVSRDGSRVVYKADQDVDQQFELYSVAVTGGPPVQLNPAMASDRDVQDYVISPDSRWVVYRSDQRADNIPEIFSVAVTGGTAIALHPTPSYTDGGYQIAPDSTSVLYTADAAVGVLNELHRAPIDGSAAPVILNDTLLSGGVSSGRITPDSRDVVYLAIQDNPDTYELYRVDILGSSASIKLSGTMVASGGVTEVAMTSDGSRVVYRADQDTDETFELYSVPLDRSSPPVKISGTMVAGGNVDFEHGGAAYSSFRITPDGLRVIYRADQRVDEQFELFSTPIDGGAPPVRVHGPMVSGGDVAKLFLGSSYSPFLINSDGRYVVFMADKEVDDQFELFVSDTLGSKVDLRVTKVDLEDPVIAGLPLSYTISVTNDSICNARDVMLTDLLPPGVTPVGSLVTNLGTLVAGGSTSITITVEVDSSTLGPITNAVTVTADATDTNPANDLALETTLVQALADLGVTKSDSIDPAVAGQDTVVYSVSVTNFGPSDARGVLTVDQLPPDVTPTGAHVVNRPLLPAGDTFGFELAVAVNENAFGTLTNSVTVDSSTPDPDTANNTKLEFTGIDVMSDVGITKKGHPDLVVDSGDLTYTMSVTNLGPSLARNVVVTDTLPGGVTPAGMVVTNLGDLAAGGGAQLQLQVAVDAGTLGTITNLASVMSDSVDSYSANDTDTAATAIQDLDGDGEPDFVDADDDADGMPDDFESGYGLDPKDDQDAGVDQEPDGFTNFEEYVADTDPNDAASFFHMVAITNDSGRTVHFDSSPNRVYTMQEAVDLADGGSWTAVSPDTTDVPGAGGPDTLTDTNDVEGAKFYRIQVDLP